MAETYRKEKILKLLIDLELKNSALYETFIFWYDSFKNSNDSFEMSVAKEKSSQASIVREIIKQIQVNFNISQEDMKKVRDVVLETLIDKDILKDNLS